MGWDGDRKKCGNETDFHYRVTHSLVPTPCDPSCCGQALVMDCMPAG